MVSFSLQNVDFLCAVSGESWREAHAHTSEAAIEFISSATTLRSAFETVETAGSSWCTGNSHVVEVLAEPILLNVCPASAVTTGGSLHSIFGKDLTVKTMCVPG